MRSLKEAVVSAVLERVLAELYHAPLDQPFGPRVMPLLAELTESRAASSVQLDPTEPLGTWNMDPEAIRNAGHLVLDLETNPWIANSRVRRKGSAVLSDDLLPLDQLKKTMFYGELLEPWGFVHALDLALEDYDGIGSHLTVHRTRAQGPFTAEHARQFRGVGTHLIRALELRNRLNVVEQRAEQLEQALEVTDTAVLVVDGDGTVQFVNHVAEVILARGAHGRIARGRLMLTDSRADRELLALVRRAARSPEAAPAVDGRMYVRRSEAAPALTLRVVGCGPRRPGACLVFLSAGDREPRLTPKRLQAQFGLTPTEARIAIDLAEGWDIDQIAARLDVRRSTVRTHLKSIRQKTDTQRQAEIVRLVLATAPTFE